MPGPARSVARARLALESLRTSLEGPVAQPRLQSGRRSRASFRAKGGIGRVRSSPIRSSMRGAHVVLVIVLSGVISAAAALPSPGEFQCYELKSAAFDPVPITVQDRFGTLTYPVRFPHRLCAPTGADPGQIPYLMGYTVDASGVRISGLSVVTRFGRSTVDLVRPDRLLVPTAIDRQRTPLAPPGGSPLQCYRVDPSSDSPKFEPIRGVEVVDGLETVTVDVLAPSLLCVPANGNGEDPSAPTRADELVCYTTQSASSFGDATVYTRNRFGADEARLIHRRELCVPALGNG